MFESLDVFFTWLTDLSSGSGYLTEPNTLWGHPPRSIRWQFLFCLLLNALHCACPALPAHPQKALSWFYLSFPVCDKVSLCSPRWPGTQCGNQIGLDPPASVIRSAGMTCVCHLLTIVNDVAWNGCPTVQVFSFPARMWSGVDRSSCFLRPRGRGQGRDDKPKPLLPVLSFFFMRCPDYCSSDCPKLTV